MQFLQFLDGVINFCESVHSDLLWVKFPQIDQFIGVVLFLDVVVNIEDGKLMGKVSADAIVFYELIFFFFVEAQ